MKIQIETLSEGIHNYNFLVLPEEIFVEDGGISAEQLTEELRVYTQPIFVDVVLEKNPRQVHLHTKIFTQREVECDRCMETFSTDIKGEYEMVYGFEQRSTIDIEDAEFTFLDKDHSIIELQDDIRQTMMISLPMKNLCNEDCLGLCIHCGKNLNDGSCDCATEVVDERWSKLLSLKTN